MFRKPWSRRVCYITKNTPRQLRPVRMMIKTKINLENLFLKCCWNVRMSISIMDGFSIFIRVLLGGVTVYVRFFSSCAVMLI